ncbi:uncharacterized protein LOC144361676 [Saccoglossus kowalevskii]
MAARIIPVIDFTAYGLLRESPEEEFFQKLIDDVHNAFKTIGFLYLTNHGIPQTLIQCLDGSFIDATPIDGSIIVNIGDLMQRWTSDKLVSAVHKVGIPKSIKKRESSRQSIAFFNVPDNVSVVKCVDGSDKYPPIRPDDYLKQKFYETFKI